MRVHSNYLLVPVFFVIGAFFFAYLKEWIIICYPSYEKNIIETTPQTQVIKKKIKFVFWQQKWKTDAQELIWPENKAEAIRYLINSWLSLLDEELIIDKKITLQTVIFGLSEQEIFLSFDQNPLSPEDSTFEKWMWVEGLLKTVKENVPTIQKVHFLVHHQPLLDDHLDFSNAWPVDGFLTA